MKHSARYALPGGLAAIGLFLAGCGSAIETAAPTKEKDAVLVKTVAAVQTEVAKTIQQPATVHPYYETELHARVPGYVVEVTADIGDFVKAGTPLARLDVPELNQQRETVDAEIDLRSAEEDAAESGLELAEASAELARAQLAQAKSEQARVEASLAAAEAEFARTEDLVNRGSLQSRVLDEVRKKRDTEAAAINTVLSAVASAEAEIGVADAQTAAAKARLKMAQAKTEIARRQLKELDVTRNFAAVTAPFDGIVSQRHVNLGDLIEGNPGDGLKPLFVLSKVDKLRIQIPVPEVDAPFVQPGDSITLTFPSFATEPPMTVSVTRRTGSLDRSTRTMTVEAEIDNPDGKLMPGMFGQATIQHQTTTATTMLPSRAVRFDESGRAFVYLVDENNRVKLAEVEPGIDTGNQIEIVSGIQPGQIVIGPHLKRFTEGQLVQPI